jgi:hypothetical protein
MSDFANACAFLKPNLVEVQVNKTLEYAIMLDQTAWRTHQASPEDDNSPISMGKAIETDPNCREVATDLQNKKLASALANLDSFKDKE